MISKMRAIVRYWFIAPLLLLVVGLQMGVGLIALGSGDSDSLTAITSTSTRRPTFTLTPTASSTPTLKRPEKTVALTASSTPEASPPTPAKTPTPSMTATRAATAIPTHTPQPVPQHVPILMYHYLSAPPADADAIRRDLSTSPEQFEEHLAYLRQAGYHTISLEQLAYAIKGVIQLPNKSIIITFDDGYRDHYENAFPILKKNGFTATFFIFTQPIDTNNVDYLSWDMVKEMHRAGMEFGSHSYRHLDMRQRDVDFLVYEIVGSSEAIEQRIGEPVRFFSYPSGRYDDMVIKVLDSAKFWGAVTTQWGATESLENRFELPRIRIRGNDTAEDLANKLAIFETH
ncbi:MAG: polysaccharide deacetylase family protein [Anaerolineae bacterium]